MKKPLATVLLATGILALAFFGFRLWRQHVIETRAAQFLKTATEHLAGGRPDQAWKTLQSRPRARSGETEADRATWNRLELQTLTELNALPRLLALYDRDPNAFLENEQAALLTARALIHNAELERFTTLRTAWTGREGAPESWFVLDVDFLLVQNKLEEAHQLLKSRSFPGGRDSGRLARLALLEYDTDRTAAWDHLERAFLADPANPDIRLFRGQVLEQSGNPALALVEYSAAATAKPRDPILADQLAEFYRRSGSHPMAIRVWASGLTNSIATDRTWIKTYFWGRLARPSGLDLRSIPPPAGDLQGFAKYLATLPGDRFWNSETFAPIPESRRFLQERQETFWLSLLQSLLVSDEAQAATLLENNRFRLRSWNLDLESALLRVLVFRRTGELRFPTAVHIPLSPLPAKSRHELFELIDAATALDGATPPMPPDLATFLRGPDVFTALLLAGYWPEAALRLQGNRPVPKDSPEWFNGSLAQAYRFNRGPEDALQFIASQTPNSSLDLLAAEIQIAEGRSADAIARLKTLAVGDTPRSFRAAVLLASVHLDEDRPAGAREVLSSHTGLRNSVLGKELEARASLAEGKQEEADRQFAALEKESVRAKSYLAQRAYQQKNWARARQLTQELLKDFPEQKQLRLNLQAILKAEGSGR
ncbi:MAG: hypothetical protein K9N62_04345 [Verrucomicrobia bacterium]|nr:hypothetical protein [Verrucomicrobiota bacterium]